MSLLSLEEAFRQDMQQDGGNASNNNNSAPLPSDAALALVNFLKYELTPQAAVLFGPHGHVFEESSEDFYRGRGRIGVPVLFLFQVVRDWWVPCA